MPNPKNPKHAGGRPREWSADGVAVTRSVAMSAAAWEALDRLRGAVPRGRFIAEKLGLDCGQETASGACGTFGVG